MKIRKELSLDFKLSVLKEIDQGGKKTDIAKKFNIAKSTLSTIIKQRAKLRASVDKVKPHRKHGPSRKRLRQGAFADVEEAVFTWLKAARSQGIPISGPILQEKALNFAFLLDHPEFKASSGWLHRFKSRHGIHCRSVCGESASVNNDVVTEWRETIFSREIENFRDKDVFNADESALFFKMLPDKTLTFKDDTCHGGKRSKERVTVMFCTNMDGSEKEKLLIIGKSKRPRCLKDLVSLPVDYTANSKAWMTTDIFNEWLLKFDRKMALSNRNVLLFIDNCSSHNKAPPLKAVTVKFLPPNCTSKLQPLDQGIIQNAKQLYRKRLVQRVLFNIQLNMAREITLKDAIDMMYGAWNEVKAETVFNCFRKAGFSRNISDSDDDETDMPEDDQGLGSNGDAAWQLLREELLLPPEITFDDYANVDDDVETSVEVTDSYIINMIKSKETDGVHSNVKESEEPDDLESEEEEAAAAAAPQSKITSSSDALSCVTDLKLFLQSRLELPGSVFVNLCAIEEYVVKSAILLAKQKKITSYFTPEC